MEYQLFIGLNLGAQMLNFLAQQSRQIVKIDLRSVTNRLFPNETRRIMTRKHTEEQIA